MNYIWPFCNLVLVPDSTQTTQVLARRPTSLTLQFPHPEAGILHYAPVQVLLIFIFNGLGCSHVLDTVQGKVKSVKLLTFDTNVVIVVLRIIMARRVGRQRTGRLEWSCLEAPSSHWLASNQTRPICSGKVNHFCDFCVQKGGNLLSDSAFPT